MFVCDDGLAANAVAMKICAKCRSSLPATTAYFPSNKAQKCGLYHQCRKCRSEVRRDRYRSDPKYREGKIASARRSYVANLETCKAKQRERAALERASDPEGWRRKKREEMARVPIERRRERLRNWRRNNPEASREQHRRAREKNPTRNRVSCLLRIHLRNIGVQTSCEPLEAKLGYTIADLKRHLERQFTPAMTWENHGPVWHIDHIIPVHLFDIKDVGDDAFRACWALTNLRPLLAFDNHSKGGKRVLLI